MRQVLILLAAVLYASAHTPAAEVVLWPRQMIGGERWFCTEGGARAAGWPVGGTAGRAGWARLAEIPHRQTRSTGRAAAGFVHRRR